MPISLDKPKTIVMRYEEFAIHHIEDYPNIYTLFIRGSEYIELPLDANVREPSEKSIPYKDMINTLEKYPYNFLLQNGGINIISSGIEIDESTKIVKMCFQPGTGIVNGGHTQLAILNSKKMTKNVAYAIIRLEVIEKEFTPGDLAIIAASRNTASNIKPYSTAEKRGYFTKLKTYMLPNFEKHIIWWENRQIPNKRGLSAIDIIARLNLFNVEVYQSDWHSGMEQPNKSATGKNYIFEYWLSHQHEFFHTYPLVNDIINLEEHILSTFHEVAPRGFTHLGVVKNTNGKKKTIFLGKDIYWDLPKQFILPLLASFRSLIKYDRKKRKIGWYVNPEYTFNRCGYTLLQELMRTYKTHHNEINQISKDPNLWRILFDTIDREISKNRVWKMYDIPE